MKAMLTTIDNPHNPFDDYEAWYAWDVSSGYNSSLLLARILKDSDQISDSDLEFAIESAIDEIVEENISGMFLKVTKENF